MGSMLPTHPPTYVAPPPRGAFFIAHTNNSLPNKFWKNQEKKKLNSLLLHFFIKNLKLKLFCALFIIENNYHKIKNSRI